MGMMKTLLDPGLSVTGHGIFLSNEHLMFIGSKCCGYPMNRAMHLPGKDDGTVPYQCMKDGTVVYGYYDSSADLNRNPADDYPETYWELSGWAKSWTGLEDICITIEYM